MPFILSLPGKILPATTRSLVNVGIDTLPTMMDFAGLEIPSQFRGLSLKSVSENPSSDEGRGYVVVSNHMVQGAVPEGGTNVPKSRGRMIRTTDYKYAVYDIGKHRESLVDMREDPHEMRNVARNPGYKGTLEKHRSILRKYATETGDTKAVDILENR